MCVFCFEGLVFPLTGMVGGFEIPGLFFLEPCSILGLADKDLYTVVAGSLCLYTNAISS